MQSARILGGMPLTLAIIAVSVVLAVLTSFGADRHLLHGLYISNFTWGGLREVFHGQVWRLFTPIFLHFGLIQVLFYMLWLLDLGSVIEGVQGTRRMFLLVLLLAVTGNLAQFLWAGPDFGGISGVLYGLLGYAWIQIRLNSDCKLVLHAYLVMMMAAWFVLCWAGVVADVSNMAQTVGLCTGLIVGWIYSPNKYREA